MIVWYHRKTLESKTETRQNGLKSEGETVSGPTVLMTGLENDYSCCFRVSRALLSPRYRSVCIKCLRVTVQSGLGGIFYYFM